MHPGTYRRATPSLYRASTPTAEPLSGGIHLEASVGPKTGRCAARGRAFPTAARRPRGTSPSGTFLRGARGVKACDFVAALVNENRGVARRRRVTLVRVSP